MEVIKYRLIACSVFTRELCGLIAASPRVVDPEFLELGLHEHSDILRTQLQQRIDALRGKGYRAILLAYGLCGNALAGIRAQDTPLVLPRAHDCATILLGSASAFLKEFGESLSAPWSSCGYLERESAYMRSSDTGRANGFGLSYEELAAQYGEENAQYLWETLHPELDEPILRFIQTPSTAPLGREEEVRRLAEAEGKQFKLIPGDEGLLRGLIEGAWEAPGNGGPRNNEPGNKASEGAGPGPRQYQVIPPGGQIKALYDFEKVVDIV